MIAREKIVNNYIDAYNNFDIERMCANLDENIKFENISNGVSNMALQGLTSFKKQAEQAKNLFIARTQTIISWTHQENLTEIEIEYNAVLAIDLPNGLKKGENLNLRGKSIFKFSGGKIIELIDIS
ncbi:MAG TPA: nuclear transport factor 2 family protein [Hanamia sp.]|nr:nuclear transport factor 2 family protein [Hanamia sp.]